MTDDLFRNEWQDLKAHCISGRIPVCDITAGVLPFDIW